MENQTIVIGNELNFDCLWKCLGEIYGEMKREIGGWRQILINEVWRMMEIWMI
jgi:hypothetical protein